jgi:hypothetical protein
MSQASSFTLQTQQNLNSNDLIAVIVGDNNAPLDSNDIYYYLVKIADASTPSTTLYQTQVEATNQEEESVPLGSNFVNGTTYTVTAIALDLSFNPISDETASTSVTFYDAPGQVTVSLSSGPAQLLASATNVVAADVSGAEIDYFLVEGFLISGPDSGSGSFIKTVARTAGDTTTLIQAGDGTYTVNGSNAFQSSQEWTVNVTAFNGSGVSSAPATATATITETPNEFALTIRQPVESDPTQAQFSFAAVDSNPNPNIDISGLSLTVTQNGVSATLDLFNDYNTYWSAPNFDALTLGPVIGDLTLDTTNPVTISFVASNRFGSRDAQTEFTYIGPDTTDSSFIPQFEASFNSVVTASNLADALVDKDVVNDLTVTANLSNVSAFGTQLSDLYTENGSEVALSLSVMDTNDNVIDGPTALSALEDDVNFTLDASYAQVKLRLTMVSTYANPNYSSTTETDSDAINLIQTQIGISGISLVQPASGMDQLLATIGVDASTDNSTTFSSVSATLYILKNNTSNALSLADASGAINVSAQSVTEISNNLVTVTFTGLSSLLRGSGLYVSATMTSAGSNSSSYTTGASDTSSVPVYLYNSPVLGAFSSGSTSVNIESNGSTVVSVLSIDQTADQLSLTAVYLGGSGHTHVLTVSDNNAYNIVFDDEGVSDSYSAQTITVNSIPTGIDSLIVHTTPIVSGVNGSLLVRGTNIINNLN